MDFDLKYWGQQNILMKIVVILGKLLRRGRVIIMKDLLYYVRVLIEVSIDEELSEIISFGNEWGGVKYYLV